MKDLVSVIVPVYKVEEYMDKCLESIVNQTYKNLEIILVDDGSPDACPEKCDEWAKRDNRIRVIHKKNTGIAFTRNFALDIAMGDYITFVDSDDYIPLHAMELMVERMEHDQSDCVIAQCTKTYSNGTQDTPSYSWLSDQLITQKNALEMMDSNRALPVYPWGKLYRRQIFEKIRYQPLKCAEDVYIFPDIIEQCKTISLVGSSLYFYYQRENSIVHTKALVHRIDSIKATLKLSRFLFDLGYLNGASRYYYSAVGEYWKTKNASEAKQLLKDSFTSKEKKVLRANQDMTIVKNIIIARFPRMYKFYKSFKRR